ncbi:MAG: TerB family tellurite resistance protein [Xanthomonadales bacterium]|nr:TerB family tellurite resistance protein [Xanthomonadales bacterium]
MAWHNNKGLLDSVVALLSELFHGGSMTPQQTVLVDTLFGLMGHLAGTDSIVTSHEADFANNLMRELDLPINGCELASHAFQRGRKREMDIDTQVQAFLAVYPAATEVAGKLYQAVLHLAVADERLRPREHIFLEHLTTSLGFDPAQLDRRLAEL